MFYVDTSLLAAYYCPEALSEKAEIFLTTHSPLFISTLTELEMFSAMSRKVRGKELSRATASRILAKFLSHLDGRFYKCFSVETRHIRLARDWIGHFNTGLKSLDALHSAVASLEGLKLVTADRDLAESAKTLAVDVMLIQPGESD
jgi:predicted nucleic acid-binding protein